MGVFNLKIVVNKGSTIWARKTIDSDVFFNKPDKWFKIWFFLITEANYKNVKQFKRGECFLTYEIIQKKTKATHSTVDHCIRWLKSARMIATRKATRGFYLSILKYTEYQDAIKIKSDTKSDSKSDPEAIQKRYRGDTINKQEKKEKKEKNLSVSKTDEEKFSFKEKLEEIKKDKNRHIQIIGLYWEYKDFSFENKEQYQAALKRELRSAKTLIGYQDDEIIAVMDWLCDNVNFKWTLETIGKFINENLDELEPFNKSQNNY